MEWRVKLFLAKQYHLIISIFCLYIIITDGSDSFFSDLLCNGSVSFKGCNESSIFFSGSSISNLDYIQKFSTIQHASLSNTSLKISRRIKQNGLLIGPMSVLLVELASLCNVLPSTDCEWQVCLLTGCGLWGFLVSCLGLLCPFVFGHSFGAYLLFLWLKCAVGCHMYFVI